MVFDYPFCSPLSQTCQDIFSGLSKQYALCSIRSCVSNSSLPIILAVRSLQKYSHWAKSVPWSRSMQHSACVRLIEVHSKDTCLAWSAASREISKVSLHLLCPLWDSIFNSQHLSVQIGAWEFACLTCTFVSNRVMYSNSTAPIARRRLESSLWFKRAFPEDVYGLILQGSHPYKRYGREDTGM